MGFRTAVAYTRASLGTAALWSAGDLLAQMAQAHGSRPPRQPGAERRRPSFAHMAAMVDWERMLRVAVFVAAVYAPMAEKFAKTTHRVVPLTTSAGLKKRALLETGMWLPASLLVYFVGMTVVDEGATKRLTGRIHDVLSDVVPRAVAVGWSVWALVHVANYYFVPPRRWPLVSGLVTVPWSAYLSYIFASHS